MISICITTRNRKEHLLFVIEQIWKHTNNIVCELIVVDDASDDLSINSTFRFNERVGIPSAKNKCLELAKYDHIFLFDDDTYPICDGWYLPYINSSREHLCYTFLPYFKVKNGFKYHTLGNGCMLYITRKSIDTIGGFDWNYGLGKYEHVDFSRRIHNAGLTESVFMDVDNSKNLLYCMDQKKEIQRSFTSREMTSLLSSGAKRFAQNRKSKEFISVTR